MHYSKIDAFSWNMLIYGVGFYLGINFTHLDVGVMKQFKIDWNDIKNFPPFLWGVLIALLVLIFSVAKVVTLYYIKLHIAKYYIAAIAVAGFIFFIKARKATDVHIHHYCSCFALTTLLCNHDIMFIALSGVTNGIFVEGGSKWGFDPIFSYGPTPSEADLSPKQVSILEARKDV